MSVLDIQCVSLCQAVTVNGNVHVIVSMNVSVSVSVRQSQYDHFSVNES